MNMNQAVREIRRQRRRFGYGDRGSLPMAILISIVGVGLVALMLPLVLTQISSSTFATERSESLHSAQSGLEMALGEIRAAVSDGGEGDRKKLPCGPLRGTVDDSGTFDVRIEYFYADDPGAHDTAWQQDNVMICVPNAGPYDSASGSGTPSFALLTSTGVTEAGKRQRTLQATYLFKTTNRNIAGGAIPMFPKPGSSKHYCLDAGFPIAAGNAVGTTPCPAGNARIPDSQKWAYGPSLTLMLTATVGDTTLNPTGAGLCLDTQAPVHDIGVAVIVKPCATVASGSHQGQAVWQQVWSINGAGHFEGSKSDYSNLDGYCLFAGDQPTAQLTLNNKCATSTTDPQGSWNPMPSVGAGQAGVANGQLVNFAQFGRCLDVTNQSVTGGNGDSFLILYPCKQNPNLDLLEWNQKWEPVALAVGDKVQWRTYFRNNRNDPYCLTSPRVPERTVFVAPCSSVNASRADQRWTTSLETDADGVQLPYAQKYVVRDTDGLCLSASPDEYASNAKVQVVACSGRADQKWNADPNIAPSHVVRLHETAAG